MHMAPAVEIAQVDGCLNSALELLRATYSTTPCGDGGWHHRLSERTAAATATAIALTAFHEQQSHFNHFDEALSFLRSTQKSSKDPRLDGGWWTETRPGIPLMEATGWVARFLGLAHLSHVEGAPDTRRAISWLVNNQNPDGGWGSHYGCPSRVWLTCLGLRALIYLQPHHAAIKDGVRWLLDHQDDANSGWGETGGDEATIIHTSFALLTLGEVRPGLSDERVSRAYSWLTDNVHETTLSGCVESYSVTSYNDPERSWDQNLYHYELPIALSALLRHPQGAPADPVSRMANTIIKGQITSTANGDRRLCGYWPGVEGRNRPSLWSTWPSMQALLDIKRVPLYRPGDVASWLPDVVVVQRTRDRSPRSIIRAHRRSLMRSRLLRHWASAFLAVCVAAGAAAVGAGWLEMKDYALSLIFPSLLLVVDQRRRGRRRAQE